MSKRTFLAIICALLTLGISALSFEKLYTYTACEADSEYSAFVIAETEAVKLVMSDVSGEFYVLIQSGKEEKLAPLKDLTEEEIGILLSGLSEPFLREKQWDTKQYTLKAYMEFDEWTTIDNLLLAISLNDFQKHLGQSNQNVTNALKELEKLRTTISTTKDTSAKEKLYKSYNDNVNRLKAEVLYKEAVYNGFLGKYENELIISDRLLAIIPDHANSLLSKSEALGLLGRYDEALKCLEDADSVNPKNLEIYLRMGTIYAMKGEYDTSIEFYQKAIALSETSTDAYRGLATVYAYQQNLDKSLELLNKAIEKKPDDSLNYVSLGTVYFFQNKMTEAQTAFKKALELNPYSAEAYFYIGTIDAKQEYHYSAIANLKKAVLYNPYNVDAYMNLAYMYEATQDFYNMDEVLIRAAQLGNAQAADYLDENYIDW
jgi:tetratricopeptide (TPR) repeat protein